MRRPASIEIVEDAVPVAPSLRTAAPPAGSTLEVRYRSRTLPNPLMGVGGALLAGIACLVWATMLATGAPLVAFLFPLPHVLFAVGAALAFRALAPRLGRTTIRIQGGTLTARQRGLRWPRTVVLERARIRWLHAREDGEGFTLEAHVDGRVIDLVRDLAHTDEVQYLEHVLGTRVGASARG